MWDGLTIGAQAESGSAKQAPCRTDSIICRHHYFAFDADLLLNRKEAKTHGEGGILVGADVSSKRVLILDDVITSGKAIRIGVDNLISGNGKIVACVLCLDREEIGVGMESVQGRTSAVEQVASEIGGPVSALIGMQDLMAWLEGKGRHDDLVRMQAYWQQYGIRKD